jgi:hypothetical protein
MKRKSYRPGLWWCAVVGFVDFGLIVYIAAEHWSRLDRMGLALLFIAVGVTFSLRWTIALSDRVREAILDREFDPESEVQIEHPLRQASILVFHGQFFALCTVGVALVWIVHLLVSHR